jgi:hypothetical protein
MRERRRLRWRRGGGSRARGDPVVRDSGGNAGGSRRVTRHGLFLGPRLERRIHRRPRDPPQSGALRARDFFGSLRCRRRRRVRLLARHLDHTRRRRDVGAVRDAHRSCPVAVDDRRGAERFSQDLRRRAARDGGHAERCVPGISRRRADVGRDRGRHQSPRRNRCAHRRRRSQKPRPCLPAHRASFGRPPRRDGRRREDVPNRADHVGGYPGIRALERWLQGVCGRRRRCLGRGGQRSAVFEGVEYSRAMPGLRPRPALRVFDGEQRVRRRRLRGRWGDVHAASPHVHHPRAPPVQRDLIGRNVRERVACRPGRDCSCAGRQRLSGCRRGGRWECREWRIVADGKDQEGEHQLRVCGRGPS